jgi:hypothetical protein
MPHPTAQELLAGLALLFMGSIGMGLLFTVAPKENHDYLLIILGALGGAMGVTGGAKAVSALTSTGPDTHIQVQPEGNKS